MKNTLLKVAAMVFCLILMAAVSTETAQAKEAAKETIDSHVITACCKPMATTGRVNVRKGPGTNYGKLGQCFKGQVANVCGVTDNGWCQLVYGEGVGYIRADLLREVPADEAALKTLAEAAAAAKQSQAALDAAAAQAQTAQAQPAAQQAAVPQVRPGSGNVVFVGDSRTGQMGNAVGAANYPNVAFVACFGGGSEWLMTTAAKKEIDQHVGAGTTIVINYGVNDLGKHENYITTINKYAQDWQAKGATVYFATVGPVGENIYGKRNWAVEYFNQQLCGRLNGTIGRIDLYGYLTGSGCGIQADGLHYTNETYAAMFTFLMRSIGKM